MKFWTIRNVLYVLLSAFMALIPSVFFGGLLSVAGASDWGFVVFVLIWGYCFIRLLQVQPEIPFDDDFDDFRF